ncbi:hypothetical protein AUEXF2481DRAFT_33696 [Aureobasidium subglaciale EXF-2481]|uniref:Cytochrome P450 n=1 Tax=Aureobasidium subglaciale (strain EXF-2481) TaxID=1043005 RepID=A0A074Y481_AURSE|nr:uncharacterized protein AUEXF2481DRAFT_33696 [Aureobasidium subglaciale EXF-2481]KEQ90754.1 hypothetical protein AUEXF2481DRAFT_33696 [Aureobasidium subglaciale EXF-2481]
MLAPAMPESCLNKLQPGVQAKVDLVMAGLKRETSLKGYMDLDKWNHFYATDVIADLAFGQSFKTSETGKYRNQSAHFNDPRPSLFSTIMGDKGQEAAVTEDDLVSNAKLYLGTSKRARLVGDIAFASPPSKPTNDQLRSKPYLDHVIDETLRLHSVIVGPLPRVVNYQPEAGRVLGNQLIPQDTTVNPFTCRLQRNSYLLPSPLIWNGDRWESATQRMKHSIYAFGGGSRACVGRHLARIELRMAVVAFLRTFEDAELAYGVEGFGPQGMDIVEIIVAKPVAEQMLFR